MIIDFLIFATRFLTSIVNSMSTGELWIICQLIPSGICLGMRGLIVWLYRTVSLSPVGIFSCNPFLYFQKLALQHVFEKEGVEGAVRRPHESSLNARQILPQDSQSPMPCMRAKVYSDVEAVD
jgi:hypothetical protein